MKTHEDLYAKSINYFGNDIQVCPPDLISGLIQKQNNDENDLTKRIIREFEKEVVEKSIYDTEQSQQATNKKRSLKRRQKAEAQADDEDRIQKLYMMKIMGISPEDEAEEISEPMTSSVNCCDCQFIPRESDCWHELNPAGDTTAIEIRLSEEMVEIEQTEAETELLIEEDNFMDPEDFISKTFGYNLNNKPEDFPKISLMTSDVCDKNSVIYSNNIRPSKVDGLKMLNSSNTAAELQAFDRPSTLPEIRFVPSIQITHANISPIELQKSETIAGIDQYEPNLFPDTVSIKRAIDNPLLEENNPLMDFSVQDPVKKEPQFRIKTVQLSPMEIFPENYATTELKPIDKEESLNGNPENLLKKESLNKGNIVADRFRILKIVSERKGKNTYLVKDINSESSKFILKEFITYGLSQEELKFRKKRFEYIIRILSTFRHEGLAKVYETFSDQGREYCLMEYIEGVDLERIAEMSSKPFSEKEVLKWGISLCSSVAFLHFRSTPFTLGNIEADHILVDNEGALSIIDYNLQRFFESGILVDFTTDNPAKLYDEIAKIAKILYFLLTKKEYQNTKNEIEWPDHVSKKMCKLLEKACPSDQRSYGDIRIFKSTLMAIESPDNMEAEKYKKKWELPSLDLSWFYRVLSAVNINMR